MTEHIELQNIGRKVSVLTRDKQGVGKITGFKSPKYQVLLDDNQVIDALPTQILFSDDAFKPETAHVANLTSAGVAGELAKVQEPLNELDQLRKAMTAIQNQLDDARQQIAQLVADKYDLSKKLTTTESTAASHLAANVKLNEQRITLEQRIETLERDQKDDTETFIAIERERDDLKKQLESRANQEVEALRMVEAERDAAKAEVAKVTHDLHVAQEQVAMFAKRLKSQRKQKVEVKTLVQSVDEYTVNYSDKELAEHLNDGWISVNFSATSFFDHGNHVIEDRRIVTLSRPIKTAPQPPKGETKTEQPPVSVPKTVIGEVVFPPVPSMADVPLNFQQAIRMATEGKMPMEDALAIGNKQAMDVGRTTFQRLQQQPRPTYSNPFMLKG